MSKPLSSAELLSAWTQAKEAERAAIERRRSLDQQIQKMLPTKDEGSVSNIIDGYKVSVTYKVDRKVDSDALGRIWATLSGVTKNAFRWNAELNRANYRELSDYEKTIVATIITAKPASPSVSVELAQKEAA